MAKVKVFMPTYQRNHLLPRSIESLLSQTFTDWICEIHNDDPINEFPSEYIKSLNDNRFMLVNHKSNIGAVNTFNLMFEPTQDEYICLLEDDNWWEPDFLSLMTTYMDAYPYCMVGYSNFWLWQEQEDGEWKKQPNPRWPIHNSKETELIYFPQLQHIFNYHHANCSLIIRNTFDLKSLCIPAGTRLDFIEPVRERAYPHPLLFVNVPLANFALTQATSRASNLQGHYEHTLLLMDSFFQNIPININYAQWLWADARQQRLRAYLRLMYAGLACKSCRKLLGYASLKEWGTFLMYNLKHPTILYNCFKAKLRYADLWNYLLIHTRQRAQKTSNL